MLSFVSVKSEEMCGICRVSLKGEKAVAHEGKKGAKHPWHHHCIKGWVADNNLCPSHCGALLDRDSLLTRVDKIEIAVHHALMHPLTHELKKITKIAVALGIVTVGCCHYVGVPINRHPALIIGFYGVAFGMKPAFHYCHDALIRKVIQANPEILNFDSDEDSDSSRDD